MSFQYDSTQDYTSFEKTKHPKKKKRKVVPETSQGLLGPGYERYDATSLVQHYSHIKEVPNHLKKYFAQRERFFSLYSKGCLLDEEGWYSVTPERIANQIAERCRCDTIVDAFCGVGGNAIAFAQTCERVIAIDNSPVRLALARHNAVVYGVHERIEFILADFPTWARSVQSIRSKGSLSPNSSPVASASPPSSTKIDIVFLSPPWGGPSYISSTSTSAFKASAVVSTNDVGGDAVVGDETLVSHPTFTLDMVSPLPGDELFELARGLTPHIAYYLPRNTDIEQISRLVGGAPSAPGVEVEKIEIEEEWMGSKLKALTCYFGGLVKGQEHLW
ncbi:S-adenosyl-L-methionine-dependent methyltransferase, partial [Clavulina sp. PMI_390]